MKIIKSSNHRILEISAAEAVAYKCAAAGLSHAYQRRARPLITLRSKRIAKLKFSKNLFAESDLNT